MATYYHGAPEIQPDGLQTLYLMNPGYAGYPDAAAEPRNMVLLNSAINTLNPTAYSHNSQSSNTQHLVGIPLHHSLPPDANHPSSASMHTADGLGHRLHYYNQWTPGPSNSNSIGMASPSQPSPHRPASTHQQGLSLSLSPQHHNLYTPYRPEPDMPVTGAPELKAMSSNTNSGLQSFLMGSKFLKATQELLDEVVSVGKGSHIGVPAKAAPAKSSRESEGAGDADMIGKRGAADLTTAERQELQTKKAKLANMLDEVEQRYRQYRQQMQILVSSFESVSGFGSARTYTSLALQTISKQFRCLRDSISGQVRSTSRSLGEEDCSAGASKSTGSRLRFVDHQLRQQRALQQLGMIQHNAWRPQRGLPEQAVSVLRAWLFEHFLHPYPKDADKLMLAKQTGLTRSQVSNWFINARVRLWKPMVEEMYTEEFKEQELSNADHEKTSKSDANEDSASKSSAHQDRNPTRTEQADSLQGKHGSTSDANLGIADNHDAAMPRSLKKSRNDQPISAEMKPEEMSNRELLMKFMDGRSSGDYSYMEGAADHLGGFGSYSIGEIGRFGHEQFAPRFSGNGVSLSLGLPHADNLSLSGTQASYLSGESMPLGRGIEMNTEPSDYCSLGNNPTPAHPPNAYGSISIQDRKRYAAQLLPDFVA